MELLLYGDARARMCVRRIRMCVSCRMCVACARTFFALVACAFFYVGGHCSCTFSFILRDFHWENFFPGLRVPRSPDQTLGAVLFFRLVASFSLLANFVSVPPVVFIVILSDVFFVFLLPSLFAVCIAFRIGISPCVYMYLVTLNRGAISLQDLF